MKVVLVNPYELGRQPFGLAQPAAWLQREGFDVHCIDLAVERLEAERLSGARLIAVHFPMHTASRIALEALPHLTRMAPAAHLCAYGLYAPPNAQLLAESGFATILGGECEPSLVETAVRLREGRKFPQGVDQTPRVELGKINFLPPLRDSLPALDNYASLILADGSKRRIGFVEGSRGCKHLCRHCPVVPVYQGRFRVIPVDVVLEDVRAQIAAGAEHISFGDPDFLNGPTHARRLINAIRTTFPELTYDCTVKVEHLLAQPGIINFLSDSGCLFVTTAVEAVDDQVLEYLEKGDSTAVFEQVVELAYEAGLALAPTFVAFTPWTTLPGYIALLEKLMALKLVEAVPTIQLVIRLLVPAGSRLLALPGFKHRLGAFDAHLLGYPWQHEDPRVDTLQKEVEALAAQAEQENWSRREAFDAVYTSACEAAGHKRLPLMADLGEPIARHSEPWYCCAEPTSAQLRSF